MPLVGCQYRCAQQGPCLPHMSPSIPQLTPLGTTHCPRLLFWLQAWQVVCASISFLLTATLCRHKHLLLVNWWKRNNDDGLGEPCKGIAMFSENQIWFSSRNGIGISQTQCAVEGRQLDQRGVSWQRRCLPLWFIHQRLLFESPQSMSFKMPLLSFLSNCNDDDTGFPISD